MPSEIQCRHLFVVRGQKGQSWKGQAEIAYVVCWID